MCVCVYLFVFFIYISSAKLLIKNRMGDDDPSWMVSNGREANNNKMTKKNVQTYEMKERMNEITNIWNIIYILLHSAYVSVCVRVCERLFHCSMAITCVFQCPSSSYGHFCINSNCIFLLYVLKSVNWDIKMWYMKWKHVMHQRISLLFCIEKKEPTKCAYMYQGYNKP